MDYFQFDLSKPVVFYKGGEFSTKEPWHHQPVLHQGDYELIYCLSGSMDLKIGDQHLILHEQELLIIPPFTKLEGLEDHPAVDFFWLHFFPQAPVNSFSAAEPPALTKREKYQITLPLIFRVSAPDQLTILFHQVLAKRESPICDEAKDFLLSTILLKIFELYLKTIVQPKENSPIEAVKEWIRINISSDLTVAKIAQEVHINPDHLTRLFKKHTGMTTHQYLNQQKIKAAQLLLLKTNLPIKQIAQAAYFHNDKVFMRQFKKELGVSPTEYRHMHQTIHHNTPSIDPQIPLPKSIGDQFFTLPENGNLF